MTDEQIAYEFVQQIRYHCSNGVAVSALRRIMCQVRATERARCLGIVERYTDLAEADWSVVEIYDAVLEE